MSIHVFTYKDRNKLLSPVAHDLCLRVDRYRVERQGGQIVARFEAESLTLVGPVNASGVDVGGMGGMETREIHKNLRKKVLHTRKHPEIRFEGEVGAGQASGQLSLHGQTKPLSFAFEEVDGRWKGRAELAPSQWGIPPFKALLGTIRLEDRVVVELDIEIPA